MKDPQNRRKFTIIDLIMILLVIILAWALFNVLGGDLSILDRSGEFDSGNGLLSEIAGSLATIGEGIKNAFTGAFR